jgi:hypothetical protein
MNVWCITLFKGLKPWSSTSLLLIIVSGYIATSSNKMRGSLWAPNGITCFLWCEVATGVARGVDFRRNGRMHSKWKEWHTRGYKENSGLQ